MDTDVSLTSTLIDSSLGIIREIRDIGSILAICAIILCGVMVIFSSDEKAVTKYKSWLIRIALGLGIVWLAPYLFSAVLNLYGGDSSGIKELLDGLKVGG